LHQAKVCRLLFFLRIFEESPLFLFFSLLVFFDVPLHLQEMSLKCSSFFREISSTKIVLWSAQTLWRSRHFLNSIKGRLFIHPLVFIYFYAYRGFIDPDFPNPSPPRGTALPSSGLMFPFFLATKPSNF